MPSSTKDLDAIKRLPMKEEYRGLITNEGGKRKVNGVEKYSKAPTKHVMGGSKGKK